MQPLPPSLAAVEGKVATEKLLDISETFRKRREKYQHKMEQVKFNDGCIVARLGKEDRVILTGQTVFVTSDKYTFTMCFENKGAAQEFQGTLKNFQGELDAEMHTATKSDSHNMIVEDSSDDAEELPSDKQPAKI